jgi:hypothetical protein
MATQILFSMASLFFPKILHRVEYIKFVIYGIVKKIVRFWLLELTLFSFSLSIFLRSLVIAFFNLVHCEIQFLLSISVLKKVDVAQCSCIVTLSIVIYVDNICIRWETDQKCSPKRLIGSVIVSVLASSTVDRGFESRSGLSNFIAISWRDQVNLQWDDDDVRFFLDQQGFVFLIALANGKKQISF